MKKAIAIFLFIGMFIVVAFTPKSQVGVNMIRATPTPTMTASEPEIEPLPDGFEFWCLEAGTVFPKDTALVQKGDDAIEAVYDENGFTITGPFSVCYVQIPDEGQNADNLVAIYDNSNSAAWYVRKFYQSEDGLVAELKHSYIVDPPHWQLNYRIELQDDNGEALFSAPLIYQRNWRAKLCWNGKMPNPVTYLCERQQDQHPWDAWYGKPMPTPIPSDD
ncbi:MAG: hypothetical protein JEZ00_04715 [Anaerolineaceae bacterium]|nr:hypothetical protein [Anaerolineaceae bacterium]